ncbi:MAG: cya [Thermoleophilia bacterium]|nr:cya [Thermoleophilia bacterium]
MLAILTSFAGMTIFAPAAPAATRWDLDASFGAAGSLSLSNDISVRKLVPASSDGYWIMGSRGAAGAEHAIVARMLAGGTLDSSFDTDGIVDLDAVAGSSVDAVSASNGDVIVALDSLGGIKLWRGTATGAARAGWGTAGLSVVGTSDLRALRVEPAPDGTFIVAGVKRVSSFQHKPLVAKVDGTTGALDASFAASGIRLAAGQVSRSYAWDQVTGLDVTPTGRITVGYQDFSYYLERYLSDGSADTTLDTDGKVIIPTGLDSRAFDVQVADSGAIEWVQELEDEPGAPNGVLLRRLLASGAPDTSFGSGGVASIDLSNRHPGTPVWVTGTARSADGATAVSVGFDNPTTGDREAAGTVRFLVSGMPDLQHGDAGLAATPSLGFGSLSVMASAATGSVIGLQDGTFVRYLEAPVTVSTGGGGGGSTTPGPTTTGPSPSSTGTTPVIMPPVAAPPVVDPVRTAPVVSPRIAFLGPASISVVRGKFSIRISCPAAVRGSCQTTATVRSAAKLGGMIRVIATCRAVAKPGASASMPCTLVRGALTRIPAGRRSKGLAVQIAAASVDSSGVKAASSVRRTLRR